MNITSNIILFLKGIIFGVANIIPGVSGGTMAVVMGIYDRLIMAIGGFFTEKEQRLSHFLFLMVLGIGAIVGLKLLAPVISFSLENYNQVTMLFFMGLITGSIPAVVKLSKVTTLNAVDMIALAVGVVLVLLLGASPENKDSIKASAENLNLTVFFLSAFLSGGAMIVPGVSGSLLMVLLGAYPIVLHAVDKTDFKLLGIFACGAALGVLVFSIIIRFLLKHFSNATHAFIFGLVGASVIVLFNGFPTSPFGWLIGTIAFVVGTALAHLSGSTAK